MKRNKKAKDLLGVVLLGPIVGRGAEPGGGAVVARRRRHVDAVQEIDAVRPRRHAARHFGVGAPRHHEAAAAAAADDAGRRGVRQWRPSGRLKIQAIRTEKKTKLNLIGPQTVDRPMSFVRAISIRFRMFHSTQWKRTPFSVSTTSSSTTTTTTTATTTAKQKKKSITEARLEAWW